MDNVSIKPPKLILFDWDGTLVDTIDLLHNAHNHVRIGFDLPVWDRAEFYQNMRYSSRDLYPQLYGDKAEEAMEKLYSYYHDNHLEQLRVLPDAKALLSALKQSDIPMGVVSNKKHDYLLREIDHLGWQDFFFGALGSGAATRDKPAPDPVHMILKQDGVQTPMIDIWFIGDTETDLLTASAAGCSAILVTNGEDRSALAEQHQPAFIARDCQDILNLFINLNGKQDLLNAG